MSGAEDQEGDQREKYRPGQPTAAGADVQAGRVTVLGQRLYSLVSLPRAQDHIVTVEVPPGVSAYDFTFG